MKRDAALLLIGIILGAVLMNIFLSRRVDELYISREKVKVELYETGERLKKIESQRQTHRKPLIREVDIVFDQSGQDSYLEVKLRESILKLTQSLIGEELEKVPHTLVVHLLEQRLVEIEGKHYRLHVRTVIMAEKVTYVLRYAAQVELNDDEP